MNHESLTATIRQVEVAQCKLKQAQEEQASNSTLVAKLLTEGDTGGNGVAALVEGEARQKLFVSRVRCVEGEVIAATLQLNGEMEGIAREAVAELTEVRSRSEERIRRFLDDEPCLPEFVPQLVADILKASATVRAATRAAQSFQIATRAEGTESVLAAARQMLSQRKAAVQNP